MHCKQCGESFPKGQPFDTFELRRHKMFPSEDGMTHSDQIEDGGVFCSRECLGDYLKSNDKSGVFDLSSLRRKLDEQK
jgi:predicted nucleic acid-binding Zn ribbon protein